MNAQVMGILSAQAPASTQAATGAGPTESQWHVAHIDAPRGGNARNRSAALHRLVLFGGDAVGLAAAFTAASLIFVFGLGVAVPAAGIWLGAFVAVSLVIFVLQSQYEPLTTLSALETLPVVARSLVMAGLIFTTICALAPIGCDPLVGITAVGFAIVLVPSMRAIAFALERRRRRRGAGHNVLVIGMGDIAVEFADRLADRPELGMHVVAFADHHRPPVGGRLGAEDVVVAGSFEDVLDDLAIDHVVVAFTTLNDEHLLDVVRRCRPRVEISVLPRLFDITTSASTFSQVSRFPLLTMEKSPCTGLMVRVKRGFDIAFALGALLVTAPLLAFVAIAIKIDDGGPVLFRQTRVGKNGERFELLKFRTMVVDAEARLAELRERNEFDDVLFKMRDDPRITRVGKILRRHSLDELPQFFNVLVGSMSVIGPRPALPHEVDDYPWWFNRRLEVPPGVTGMWQISGRSDLDFSESTTLDLYYVEHWSAWLDLKILIRTIGVVLHGHGGY